MLATALWRPQKKNRENTHHSRGEERWQSMTRIQRALRGSYDLNTRKKKNHFLLQNAISLQQNNKLIFTDENQNPCIVSSMNPKPLVLEKSEYKTNCKFPVV
jgi:hypothetical protein